MSELVLYYEGGAAAPEGGARLRNGAGPESTHTTFSLNTNHQTERTTPEEQRRTAMGAPPKRSRAEFWLIQLWYVISLKRSSGRCGQLDRKALERIREVKQRLVPPSQMGALMRAVLWLSVFAIGVRALTVSTTGVRPAQPTPAVVPNSYSLHDAASAGDVGAVELLLAAGLSSDTRNDRSSTPLHLACALGHDDVAAVLLGRGASANAPNQDGNTPLHAAVGAGQLPCVQLLLSHGADADATSNAGTQPLRSAVHRGDAAMVDAFVLAGAELDEDTAQAAFWVAVQRLEAEADGEPLPKEVPALLQHVFAADMQQLLQREKQVQNVTYPNAYPNPNPNPNPDPHP